MRTVAAKRKPAAKPQGLDDIIRESIKSVTKQPVRVKTRTGSKVIYKQSSEAATKSVKGAEALGKTFNKVSSPAITAAKWWYGENPKDIAINTALSAIPVGKGVKAIKNSRNALRMINSGLSSIQEKPKSKKKKGKGK